MAREITGHHQMTIVNNHFALRICRYDSAKQPSGRADGMFIRNDGGLTDAKISAKVFDSEAHAERFFEDLVQSVAGQPYGSHWIVSTPNVQVFVVAVVTKTVVKQANGTG